jgi:hypothetical protein
MRHQFKIDAEIPQSAEMAGSESVVEDKTSASRQEKVPRLSSQSLCVGQMKLRPLMDGMFLCMRDCVEQVHSVHMTV